MKKYWEKRKRRKSILLAIEKSDSGYGCYSIDVLRELGEKTTGPENYSKIAKELYELKGRGMVDFQQTGTNIFDLTLRNIRLTPKSRSKWLLYRDGITSFSAIIAAIASVIAIFLTFFD